jgi:hypothetical protein
VTQWVNQINMHAYPSNRTTSTTKFYFRTILRVSYYSDTAIVVGLLQCQNNMKLVFCISEYGSEIELKHCASSKTSVESSRKYFVHLNWIRLATNRSVAKDMDWGGGVEGQIAE